MNSQTPKATLTSGRLINEGKSRRLATMMQRDRPSPEAHVEQHTSISKPQLNQQQKQQWQQMKTIIDKAITQILDGLPVNKRDSLFKIRFGMTIDELYRQPIKSIVKTLHIPYSQHPDFKQVANLDYFGQRHVDK